VLVFNQSAHPAWIAFPSNRPWQLLDHRTYNGWANAWIVPAGTTTVTMLFWPQLLSFLGYGVLIITFGWLTVAALRQRSVRNISVGHHASHPAINNSATNTSTSNHTARTISVNHVRHTTAPHELHHFVIQRFVRLRKRLLGK
jgi:hypothetical protein